MCMLLWKVLTTCCVNGIFYNWEIGFQLNGTEQWVGKTCVSQVGGWDYNTDC